MVGRNAARVSVLLAIVVVAAGTYLIVSDHLNSSSTKTASVAHAHSAHPRGRYARATFYTVQQGENLTNIAAKTGVALDTLVQLNPSLSPNALQAGQRIRLQR